MDLLQKLADKKAAFIDENLLYVADEAKMIQKELLDLIFSEFVSKLKFENGKLVNSVDNYKVLNQFDSLLDDFSDGYLKPFVSNIGTAMLELTPLNAAYFEATGAKKTLIDGLTKKLSYLQQRIGVDAKGNLIKGSYMDNLAKTPELRIELKNYVLKNVVNESGMKQFQKGFRDILTDTKDADGSLTRYYKQYTYDTFNQVDETINSQFADNLGLKYFIYSGTLIKTSRCFCRKRVGKIFHIDDTKNWVNDSTLPTTPNYNPIIDRGSYNCRHNIRWVSEEYAMEKGYSKEEATIKLGERCAKNNGS